MEVSSADSSTVSRINYGHLFRYDHQLDEPLTTAPEPEKSNSTRTVGMVAQLKSKLLLLQRQRDAMEIELKSATEMRDQHLNAQSAFRTENDELRRRMDELAQAIDEKQLIIDSLKQTADQGRDNVATIQQAAEKERKSAKEMQQKVEEYEKAIDGARWRVELAKAQTEALRQSLADIDKAQVRETAMRESLLELLKDVRKQVEAQVEKIKETQEAFNALQEQRSEVVQATKSVITEMGQSNDNDIVSLRSSADVLLEQLKEQEEREVQLGGEVDQCKSQLDNLVTRIRQYQG
ncbi:hypothetical protein EC973_009580 [Apophysomyces ossiformis]|uniref:SWI5-dependent HO expression protein 3 n=1 Tax=Apophysomyces ossiformis TaxID=679940 RepID=A0A8H7EPG3_9FUNG|nr:hypothetical protein EC973_009580 [Apophysomyces ossiformis]